MNGKKITVNELKSELKKLGVTGYSRKNKEELLKMYNQTIILNIKKNKKRLASNNIASRITRPFSSKSRKSRKFSKEKFNVLFDDNTVNEFKLRTGTEGQLFSKNFVMSNKKRKKKFIDSIPASLCGGLEDYMWDSLEIAHENIKKYKDEEKWEEDNSVDYVYIVDSENIPCGILLAHRGECREMRSWWTVRLICNDPDPVCKGTANKLLGMYSFALKSKKIQTHGLLEIAENYENIGGYCLYSRYGFVESNISCDAFGWMTMANELRNITFNQIIETVKTGKKQIQDTGSTLYCEELKNSSRKGISPKDRYDPEFNIEPMFTMMKEKPGKVKDSDSDSDSDSEDFYAEMTDGDKKTCVIM